MTRSFEEALTSGTRALGRRVGRVPGVRWLLDQMRTRSARAYAQRPERWITLVDFDGDMRMRVDRSAYLGSGLYWMGFNSPSELAVCARLLRPDSVFLDVGANQGEFTLFAAKRLPQGRVVACEPVRHLHEQLCENVASNQCPNVTILNCGCADVAGPRDLYSSSIDALNQARNEGLASLFANERRNTVIETVMMRTLDDIAGELALTRVDLIKVDVEGAELQVLRGGRGVLERLRPDILLEVSESSFAAAGYTRADLYVHLHDLGYALFVIGLFGRLHALKGVGRRTYCNILCRAQRE